MSLREDPLVPRGPEGCGQHFRNVLAGLLQGPVLQDPVKLNLILAGFDVGRTIDKKFSGTPGRFRPETLARLSMGHRDSHDHVHATFSRLTGRKRE